MSHLNESSLAQEVTDWISQCAKSLNIDAEINTSGIVVDHNRVSVSVAIIHPGVDAYDRASLLQAIEDLWEPAEHSNLRLWLLPGKRSEPTKSDISAEIGDLLTRQHQFLDKIDPKNVDAETAEKFMAIRREWFDKMAKAERLFPSFANDAPQ